MTVVLDDDPTGTQEVSGVPVLLERDRAGLRRLLARHDAVFVLTNTRSMSEAQAVDLVSGLLDDIREIEHELGVAALVVQRGDSTMRGHVFAEVDAADPDAVVVFCPAFPAGGRRTVGGVHEVRIDGAWVNAADTEFAQDPVFGYRARSQVQYVAEKGRGRRGISVTLTGLAAALRDAAPRTVLLPDVTTDEDIQQLAGLLREAFSDGCRLVVRCAAPLAAYLAKAKSDRHLTASDLVALRDDRPGGVLVVVGSHTRASTEQLERLLDGRHVAHELSTEAALADPQAAGADLALRAREDLRSGLAVIATARHREQTHGSLEHARSIMTALTTAARRLAPEARSVVAKGGITSAEVARLGLGRRTAWVAGQVLPGVSVWTFSDDTDKISAPGLLYAVVPGNIGESETLLEVVALISDSAVADRPRTPPVAEGDVRGSQP